MLQLLRLEDSLNLAEDITIYQFNQQGDIIPINRIKRTARLSRKSEQEQSLYKTDTIIDTIYREVKEYSQTDKAVSHCGHTFLWYVVGISILLNIILIIIIKYK